MEARKKEICLSAFLALFVFITIGLLIALLLQILVFDKHKKTTEVTIAENVEITEEITNICTSAECVISAGLFVSSMNLTQSPCTDFYEYVCGRFEENNPIPDDRFNIDVFSNLDVKVGYSVRGLLEEEISKKDPEWKRKAKSMFKFCMDFEDEQEKGVKSLKDFLKSLGDWPLLVGNSWLSTPNGLEILIGKIGRYGIQSKIVDFDVEADEKNPDVNIIYIDQFFQSSSFVKSYRPNTRLYNNEMDSDNEEIVQFVKGIAALLGKNDTQFILPEVVQMAEIEEDLQEITVHRNKRQNPFDLYNRKTVRELQKLTGNALDWKIIFNTMFAGITTITDDEEIIVMAPDYFRNLTNVIKQHSTRSLTNYIIWQVVYQLIEIMPSDAIKLLDEFNKQTEDIEPTTRWRRCVETTIEEMENAVSRMYIDKYVDKNIKKIATEIVNVHLEAYRKMITDSPWVDKETEMAALKKISTIRINVGYPDYILDDKELNEEYSNLSLTSNHFLNVLRNMEEQTLASLQDLRNPVDKDSWSSEIMVANAFYEPVMNSINFPVVILSPPYLMQNNILALTYGALGSIIGHEIGHAFDSAGSLFDHTGALNVWWTNSTQAIFKNKSDCFVQQYNKFCPSEMLDDDEQKCIDGVNTLGENIADDTGLRSSFIAYTNWLKENGPEKRLPGLEHFNEKQLFFISHAYSNCENINAKHYSSIYEDEVHSPNEYRVLGVMHNFYEFHDAFNCVRPNENEICTIW